MNLDYNIKNGVLIGFNGDKLSLIEAIIPDGVVCIGEQVFKDCKNLRRVILPNTVATIDFEAFRNCQSLADVYLPKSLKTIGNQAFLYCLSLKRIKLPNSISHIGKSAFLGSGLQSVALPSGLTQIEASVFSDCKSLESVQIPSTVLSIGYGAFADCIELKSLILPDSVKTISQIAFRGCINIKEMIIPDSVEMVEFRAAFYGWGEDQTLFINNDKAQNWSCEWDTACCAKIVFRSENNPQTTQLRCRGFGAYLTIESSQLIVENECYYIIENGNATLVRYFGQDESFEIPRSITYKRKAYNVKSIGCAAFASRSLTGIIIPSFIEEIGYGAFSRCARLQSISISHPIKVISDYLFDGCTSLKNVQLHSGIEAIGKRAFARCEALDELELPQKLKSIGEEAFSGSSIGQIRLPNGLKTLGKGAFFCTKLNNIELPTGITYEGTTFYACHELTQITLPPDLTAISEFMFDASGLKTIDLPQSVTHIGYGAFYHCHNLESVYLPNGLRTMGNWAFRACRALKSITLPLSLSIVQDSFIDCVNLTIYTSAAKNSLQFLSEHWNKDEQALPIIWDCKLSSDECYVVSINTQNITNITNNIEPPHRKGYGFDGWNTLADGTGTFYELSRSLPAKSIILYAIWSKLG